MLQNQMKERKEKMKRRCFKENKGITLIALVVTIVVLIILATISINAVMGNDGIIKKAEKTKELQSHASVGEAIRLAYMDYEFEQTTGITASVKETKLASVETGIKLATANNETFLEYLIRKGYADENGVVNVENLLGNRTGVGEGTGSSDVYKVEETEDGKYELNYYNKEEEQLNLGEVGAVKEAEADPNKIIDVIYVGSVEEIYVLTQAGEVKCLTGANAKPSNVTSWKTDNTVTISQNGVKEVGDMYFIDNAGKLYIWGDLAYHLTGNYDMICVNDIEGSSLNGKNVAKFYSDRRGYEKFVIDSEGKVHAWGENDYGTLGNGTTENITVPTCISDIPNSALNGKEIVDIQARFNAFAIDREGRVYSWGGANTYGQLGNGTTDNNYIPICISDLENHIFNNKKLTKINIDTFSYGTSGVEQYVSYIDQQGKVYTCGYNEYGYLGTGDKIDSSVPVCISDIQESSLYGKKIIEVDMSTGNAIDENGNIHYWGSNQLLPVCKVNLEGSGLEYQNIVQKKSYSVKYVSYESRYVYNVLVLDNQGKIYTTSEEGNIICMNDIEGSALNGKNVVYMEGKKSDYSTVGIALDEKGKVYTWGNNSSGALGNGTTENITVPTCISDINNSLLNGKEIVNIQFKSSNTYAIDSEGKVYAWGPNDIGQLGNGSEEDAILPISINDIENSGLSDKKIEKVILSVGTTMFLTEDGELFYSAYNVIM